jgi:ribosome maturation factor RimP
VEILEVSTPGKEKEMVYPTQAPGTPVKVKLLDLWTPFDGLILNVKPPGDICWLPLL